MSSAQAEEVYGQDATRILDRHTELFRKSIDRATVLLTYFVDKGMKVPPGLAVELARDLFAATVRIAEEERRGTRQHMGGDPGV